MVDDLSAKARQFTADVIVAIGGGSIMDCAKAAALVTTNPGQTEDYQLKRREIQRSPIAQVFAPTTAGTGSEANAVSVLTNERAESKEAFRIP